jgi:hypothetical protein
MQIKSSLPFFCKFSLADDTEYIQKQSILVSDGN